MWLESGMHLGCLTAVLYAVWGTETQLDLGYVHKLKTDLQYYVVGKELV